MSKSAKLRRKQLEKLMKAIKVNIVLLGFSIRIYNEPNNFLLELE